MKKRQTWAPWPDAEQSKLDRLRGEGLSWEAVAAQMQGRTQWACQQRYSVRHGKSREKPAEAPAPRQAPLAPVMAALQAAESKTRGRRISLASLMADADLRARIAEQGPTAGLFGDPPAGRSALDDRLGRGRSNG